jgi:hypothetical protein
MHDGGLIGAYKLFIHEARIAVFELQDLNVSYSGTEEEKAATLTATLRKWTRFARLSESERHTQRVQQHTQRTQRRTQYAHNTHTTRTTTHAHNTRTQHPNHPNHQITLVEAFYLQPQVGMLIDAKVAFVDDLIVRAELGQSLSLAAVLATTLVYYMFIVRGMIAKLDNEVKRTSDLLLMIPDDVMETLPVRGVVYVHTI